MKRIILTGGGTAGHVTPNIALLPRLRELQYDIHYIGSYNGMEKQLVEQQGIPYHGISSGKLRRYFSLQKERDGEKIQLEINIQQVERYSIVPISLQILVENALKHNSASEKNPLRIIIQNENDPFIVISNNIQKRSTWSNSPGTGLSNLKERVRLIMGKEMTIETEQNQFTVKLPINII